MLVSASKGKTRKGKGAKAPSDCTMAIMTALGAGQTGYFSRAEAIPSDIFRDMDKNDDGIVTTSEVAKLDDVGRGIVRSHLHSQLQQDNKGFH